MATKKPHTAQPQKKQLPISGKDNVAKPNTIKNFKPATSFQELIDLVRATETQLIANGYDSAEERVHVIRGIYYGTTWSADYQEEKSPVRNAGFQVYTSSGVPDDPRPFLKNNLFEAMRQSRDVREGDRHIDFSHVIIGMDARRSFVARNTNLPMNGGTGLELSTWLGDIGGGAGMLAKDRVTSPSTPAMTRFMGLNFGGSNNLEGDVGGYLVARDKTTDGPTGLDIPKGKLIADALEEYLSPGKPGSEWNDRCTIFLKMLGGQLKGSTLSNRKDLVAKLGAQVAEFSALYLLNRLRQQNKLSSKLLEDAYVHLVGAANEVAQVFVDALVYSHAHKGARLQARPPAPSVTPKAKSVTVGSTLLNGVKAKEAGEEGAKGLEELEKKLKKTIGW